MTTSITTRLISILSLAYLCSAAAECSQCVTSVSMKPTITQVTETGGKKTNSEGGEIVISLQQCETSIFKAKWDALNEQKAKLNTDFKSGAITKEFYDSQVKEIDRLIAIIIDSNSPKASPAPKGALQGPQGAPRLSQEQLAIKIDAVLLKIQQNLNQKRRN